VIVALLAFFVSGCATTGQKKPETESDKELESDQKRTKIEGAAIGALAGGLLGVALGGDSKVAGALIGAAVGAGAGYLVGNEVAKRKAKYASEEDFLDAEIETATEFNQTAREYNEALRVQIAELDVKSQELRTQYEAGLREITGVENPV
jgi:phage tail tape-measure protein